MPVLLALAAAVVLGRATGRGAAVELHLIAPGGSATLELERDTLISIPVRDGMTVVEIGDGRARIVSSPCPSRTCVMTGWISAPGQAAVCMPEGVSLEIKGTGEEPDAVSY